MGGFFGVVSKHDCVTTLYYGTDYHCHLGTKRGGMAVSSTGGFTRFIKDISSSQFRSKFEEDLGKMQGNSGIGVISDYEDQPLIIGSHLGTYALATVGVAQNLESLAKRAHGKRGTHFSEMSGNEVNPTELVATLINEGGTFEEGIQNAQQHIVGSCSILLLTEKGLYAARDRFGRTPVILGKGSDGYVAATETTALPNIGYEGERDLGPGEVVLLTAEGCEQRVPPGDLMQICSFLWIYYGYPASTYEGVNVESSRYRCGQALARRDEVVLDFVAGIPDSGTAHAIGYAHAAGVPYRRPFVKYTPTWPRSFMPQDQAVRDLVGKMKLVPIRDIAEGARILFCDDSVVRGTQLRETLRRMFDYGAREVHLRPACPPLLYGCKFLNFSRSRSELDLAGRSAVDELEKGKEVDLGPYANPSSSQHRAMVEVIRKRMGITTLQYQRLDDMVEAIGLPRERLCTYCWDGSDPTKGMCGA